MKILFLIHQFYPTCQYGAETYAYHLGQGLQERGHQVHIFHRENHIARRFQPGEKLQEEDIDVDGLTVHRVFLNPRYSLDRGAFFHFLTTFYNPSIERAFAQYVDDLRPDLVHVHHLLYLSGGLIPITRQRGIPVMGTLHDFWYFCSNAQLLRPGGQLCDKNPGRVYCGACMKALYGGRIPDLVLPLAGPFFTWQERYLRRAMSQADVLISPSQFLLERHIQAGYPREKLVFLENSFPSVAAQARVPIRETGLPLQIAYIGSLTRHKGVHVLIEAFRQIPSELASLDVYGSPDAFPKYSAWLQELAVGRPNIRFRGAFEHHLIEQVLRGVDLLIVPSLWYENSPVVIQEALTAGIPVIGSRIGALPEKVHDGTYGSLFEPGNADDLRQVLLQVVRDPDRILEWKLNLQMYKNDFGMHLDNVQRLYERCQNPR
jgi:glycosyltransferase involved in cell wall biosynthesis